VSPRIHVPTREERLRSELGRLVAQHGLDAVYSALSAVRDDTARRERPRSAARAIATPGRFVTETTKAVLWFCPRANDEREGLAAWIPKSQIVDLVDPILERHHDPLGPPPALGVLRTDGQVEWRRARRSGSTVYFYDERRTA
jgi:hypothetical protein